MYSPEVGKEWIFSKEHFAFGNILIAVLLSEQRISYSHHI